MIGLLWRLLGRRLGWLFAAAVGRSVARTLSEREVNKVADELDGRLPSSLRAAADRVPGDPVRASAQAVIAGRSLRKAASGSARVAKAANDGRRTVSSKTAAASSRLKVMATVRQDLERETARAQRELNALRLRSQGSQSAADDALLDLRPDPMSLDDDRGERRQGPAGEVPEPIAGGRRRAVMGPRKLVQRVQRSYRKPARPWEH